VGPDDGVQHTTGDKKQTILIEKPERKRPFGRL
jgi:hypothetical protein